jgi:adenylosuccinate lyase
MRHETLSPLDDRYKDKTADLLRFFSGSAQTRLKAQIEIDYFISLMGILGIDLDIEDLSGLGDLRSRIDVDRIDDIERDTRHDIKAIEIYLAEEFKKIGKLGDLVQFIHFGLTSQDINSVATSLSVKGYNETIVIPLFDNLTACLCEFADKCDTTIPARTHGQIAVPTSLKKEILVFYNRVKEQARLLRKLEIRCKFGGAVGNLTAHKIAYPDIQWDDFMTRFCKERGLRRNSVTTQVDNNDWLAEYMQITARLNGIMLDLCRDMWLYMSFGYFKKQVTRGEVGSSTMPQKINPIEFENAEGNLEISNALLNFMSGKLQISRLQRDLTDTTVIRNLGVPFGHTVVAMTSIVSGISKLQPNLGAIRRDLYAHPEMIAEAIQTILRSAGVKNAYDLTKFLSRDGEVSSDKIETLLSTLNVDEQVKDRIRRLDIDSLVRHV